MVCLQRALICTSRSDSPRILNIVDRILMSRYIGDAKAGRLVGTDQLGNRYYENVEYGEEVPGELILSRSETFLPMSMTPSLPKISWTIQCPLGCR